MNSLFKTSAFTIGMAMLALTAGLNSCKKPTPAAIVAAAGLGSCTATINGSSVALVPGISHNSGVYSITASQSNPPVQSIIINTGATATGTYTINSGISSAGTNAIYATGPTTSQLTKFRTDTLHTGTLTITAIDTVKKIMSGNFSFTAKQFAPTVSTATVSVTSGVFTNAKW